MRKLSRSARALLTIAGLLVLISVVALVVIPPVSSARVESAVRDKLESRGVSVASIDAKLRADGQVVVSELCVNDLPPYEQEKLACVRGLAVDVALFEALRGSPQIQAVTAELVELWMPSTRGSFADSGQRLLTLLSKADDDDEDEEDDESDGEDAGPLSELRGIDVESVVLHLDGHPGVTGPQRVNSASASHEDETFAISFEVVPSIDFVALLGSELSMTETERVNIEARLDLAESRITSMIARPEPALRLDVERAGRTLAAELGGISFTAPYAISLLEPRFAAEGAFSAHATTATLEPGSWTTDFSDLFVANLVFDQPVVEIESVDAMKMLASEGFESDTNAQEPGSPEADNGAEPTAEPSIKQRIAEELDDRKWWEILPRRLEMREGTIRLASSETRPTIEWSQVNIVYAMRYIRFQMDVEAAGELYVGAAKSGSIGLDGFWNYQQSTLNADLTLDDFELGELSAAFARRDDVEVGGVVSSQLHVSGGLDEGFSFSLNGSLDEPYAQLPLFRGQYGFDRVEFTLPGRLGKDDEGWGFSMNAEQFDVDEAHFGGGVVAKGLGNDGLIASELLFHLEIPDQPIMNLYSTIPGPILGPLVGTEMSGDFGLTLRFAVLLSRDDDQSLDVTIEDPTVYDFRDDALALDELPEDVDVRRLNRSMTFIFRGPDDAIMRRLRIPAPSFMRNYAGIAETDETPLNWTRLWDISFYVIAAQLYREDGSFFRNSGINWYQLRRVTADAIEARKLGRGASTISMQLVKNLFLTHERSVERKLQELFLTYWMTRIVPKERILEVYLNVIEWGPNLNGVREAAEFYFQKDPTALSVIEGTWLSSITPDPVDLGGDRPRHELTAATCRRCRYLVEGLSRRGWISRMETNVALDTPSETYAPAPRFQQQPGRGSHAPDPDGFGAPTQSPFGQLPAPTPFGPGEMVDAPSDFQLMSPNERLRDWVNSSRILRGDGL